MATFLQLFTDLKGRCSLTDDSTYDTLLKQWLNAGQKAITRRYIWPFLQTEGTITTVASTETYSLASDVSYIYLLRNITSNRILTFISFSEFYHAYPNPTGTGSPTLFRLSGNSQTAISAVPLWQVSLYPIPGDVYSIKYPYYRKLVDLSADSDISAIPDEYHELMVNYAASIYFESKGDSRAISQNDRFESGLTDMAERLSGQPVDRIEYAGQDSQGSTFPFLRFPSSFEN